MEDTSSAKSGISLEVAERYSGPESTNLARETANYAVSITACSLKNFLCLVQEQFPINSYTVALVRATLIVLRATHGPGSTEEAVWAMHNGLIRHATAEEEVMQSIEDMWRAPLAPLKDEFALFSPFRCSRGTEIPLDAYYVSQKEDFLLWWILSSPSVPDTSI